MPRRTDQPPESIDVAALAAHVDGWLSEAQGRALFEAARRVSGRGIIVEIGSWKGRSTIWLAAGARLAGRKVYAIDPHVNSSEDPGARTLDAFLRNVERAGVADVIEPLVMTSSEAAAVISEPVELLFIDGDHSHAGAARDVDVWLPRLIEGGTAMFHDVTTAAYAGPRRAFQRFVCLSGSFEAIQRVGSMTVARRTARRSLSSAIWGATVWLLLYIYDGKAWLRRARRGVRSCFLHDCPHSRTLQKRDTPAKNKI